MKNIREKKNRGIQRFLAYLRLHDFSEKQLSHMKFEELERMKKKSSNQKDKLGGKCKFLIDHGISVEHVEGISKKAVEESFRQILEKSRFESSIGNKKPKLITLVVKEKKASEDEKILLVDRLMTARGEGGNQKHEQQRKTIPL